MKMTPERTRENRLRRLAHRNGYAIAKASRADIWFLFKQRGRKASVYYSLDDLEAALSEEDHPAAMVAVAA